MVGHIAELAIGILLAVAGLLSLKDKRISIGLGNSNSPFRISLTDKRAILFGCISILSSVIVLIPWVYINATNAFSAMTDNTLPAAAILGLMVAAFGFVLSFIFQVLENIRINAEEQDHKMKKLPNETVNSVNEQCRD